MAAADIVGVLPVAILAGGRGTRIAAIAGDRPKALIEVAGKPFVAHQLTWLARGGVTDVVLCLGYGAEAIRAFVGDGRNWNLRIAYSEDGEAPLGTGGALLRAISLLGNAFLTVYGDALLQCAPLEVVATLKDESDAVMTVFENRDRGLKSNVRVEGENVTAYDKEAPLGTMTHIDYGLNAFRARAFSGFTEGRPFDLAEVHRAAIERGALRALPCPRRWYEIGSPEGLAETENFILAQRSDGYSNDVC